MYLNLLYLLEEVCSIEYYPALCKSISFFLSSNWLCLSLIPTLRSYEQITLTLPIMILLTCCVLQQHSAYCRSILVFVQGGEGRNHRGLIQPGPWGLHTTDAFRPRHLCIKKGLTSSRCYGAEQDNVSL